MYLELHFIPRCNISYNKPQHTKLAHRKKETYKSRNCAKTSYSPSSFTRQTSKTVSHIFRYSMPNNMCVVSFFTGGSRHHFIHYNIRSKKTRLPFLVYCWHALICVHCHGSTYLFHFSLLHTYGFGLGSCLKIYLLKLRIPNLFLS